MTSSNRNRGRARSRAPATSSRPRSRALRPALMALGAALLLALAAATGYVLKPLPPDLLARTRAISIQFTDRGGAPLRELRSREDGRSLPLPPGHVPEALRQAFLAAEDRRFYQHPGVDLIAVGRALVQNLRAGRIVSGASTIPMQLARRIAPHPRTPFGKVQEALLALRLCRHLSKERILRAYLDRIPLGNAVIGAEAAAHFYFDRPAAALSVGQAALLAGLARSPATGDPFRRPAVARARAERVISAMVRLGALDAGEARRALQAPLDLVRAEQAFRAPHLMARLARDLTALGLDAAARVQTTLDSGLQRAVEQAMREELDGLADRRIGQAAVIVVDNPKGEVLAYVGSVDFLDDARGGQNDGVRARRQPGSALKPFAYGLALAQGLTPATLLSDVQLPFATPGGAYVPQNYDRRAHGPVRLRSALANSYNVPAVQIAERLGPARILEVLRRAGFDSLGEEASHYGVGLVLGNGEVSLRELAQAYRGLARGGLLGPLIEIASARDAEGRALPIARAFEERRFLPEDAVALLTDILADEPARAAAFGHANALRFPFPVAAKTGTSRAHVDNWVAGFTRERTVAVWVGNFDGQPMRGVSGITGAGPLFRRVMLLAMAGLSPAPLVDSARLERADICPLSGARVGPFCDGRLTESFLPGTAPAARCAMHAGPGALALGPSFYGWARAEGRAARPAAADAPSDAQFPGARFLLPADGDEFLIDPSIPIAAQSISVQAVPPQGIDRLELATPEGARLTLTPPFAARLPARRGRHQIALFLPGGEVPLATARFRVR